MGSFSAFHWIVVLLAIVLLFGTKRLPQAMGDIARGVKQFRAGLRDENAATESTPTATPELPRDTAPRA